MVSQERVSLFYHLPMLAETLLNQSFWNDALFCIFINSKTYTQNIECRFL